MRRRLRCLVTRMKSGSSRPSGSLRASLTKIYVRRFFLCLTTDPLHPPALGYERPSSVSSLLPFVSKCISALPPPPSPPPFPSGMRLPLRTCLPAVHSAPPCTGAGDGGGWWWCYGALCCHGYHSFFFLFLLFLA